MILKVSWIIPAILITLGMSIMASSSANDIPIFSYAWANACQECHQEIFKAWSKTKHRMALNRLGKEHHKQECLRCHVTGPTKIIVNGDAQLNAGVQCEACHGPGLDHSKTATDDNPATESLVLPNQSVCVRCHCDDSPHYQWFDYRTLKRFVHSHIKQ
jgi:hypothetical protein